MSQAARSLRPYQTEGVDFLKNKSAAALGDEPGLGKSIQAIRALPPEAKLLLVICPAIGRVSWEIELKAEGWGVFHATRDTKTIPLGATIVTWDTLSRAENTRLQRLLSERGFDAAILDEAHYAKSHAANRTKAVYGKHCDNTGILKAIPRIFLLSGTLAPNHAGELWTHVNALFRDVYDDLFKRRPVSRIQWEDRFCKVRDTQFGRAIVGSKDLPVLREALKPYILARKKRDVLKDLPPLQFVDEPIEGKPPEFAIPAHIKSDDALEHWLQQNSAALATERRALGLAKVPATIEWARNQLEGGVKKLILFGVHTDVLDRLRAGLLEYKPCVITGKTLPAERAAAVKSFQTDPDRRVFIGNIQAAGTAITLTAASDVAIIEPSWTPAENYQAACRAHRIGQHDGVVCRFLLVPNTLDDRICRTFRRKAAEIANLFE